MKYLNLEKFLSGNKELEMILDIDDTSDLLKIVSILNKYNYKIEADVNDVGIRFVKSNNVEKEINTIRIPSVYYLCIDSTKSEIRLIAFNYNATPCKESLTELYKEFEEKKQ